MIANDSKKTPKNAYTYHCEFCDFNTCNSADYTRHVATRKHQKHVNGSEMVTNDINKTQQNAKPFACSCGKKYSHDSGFYRHKKTCTKPQPIDHTTNTNFALDKEFVMMVLKQNSEILKVNQEVVKENHELKTMMVNTQNQIMEVLKTGTHHTTNNTNSHNKTFNLQFFLNETCKNAMNIMDFVDSLKLQLNDLERMGEIGFVNGMSNIIIKNLQNMDVTERPVHCTDQKREVIYVKDADKWDKEDDTKPKLRKAIKHIAHKNAKLIGEFKTKHPDYCISASKISTQYNTMVIEAMGGIGSNDLCNENKIIKRISKEIMVDKD
jgi:hypothetical protein